MPVYQAKKISRSEFIPLRELSAHVRVWGEPDAPLLVMLHGWMDVSASFQFLVDALSKHWRVISPDWRGYGLTQFKPVDTYWFQDYLADFDALIDHYSPHEPINLVAHSLGGNVASIYAGVRPQRIKALLNLEGYGMPEQAASIAPRRYAKWLDELKEGPRLRDYANLDEVAAKLQANNPRLSLDKAQFLASHWSKPVAQPDGSVRYALAADPAHKLINPVLYRVEEVVACWKQITAPVMLVDSDRPDAWAKFTREEGYSERLKSIAKLERVLVTGSGHMLHHDQPERIAELLEGFILHG